jgi:hypothetical protein
MTDVTYIHTGFAGFPQAKRLRAGAATLAWAGGRTRTEVNPMSLAERWKG